MRYIDILAKFLDTLPMYMDQITSWSPFGKMSIRVVTKDCSILVFTRLDDMHWKLEMVGKEGEVNE